MSKFQTQPCASCFNKMAGPQAAEQQKPPMPLHLICPCYRPKF
jgi:hypothetical protein